MYPVQDGHQVALALSDKRYIIQRQRILRGGIHFGVCGEKLHRLRRIGQVIVGIPPLYLSVPGRSVHHIHSSVDGIPAAMQAKAWRMAAWGVLGKAFATSKRQTYWGLSCCSRDAQRPMA